MLTTMRRWSSNSVDRDKSLRASFLLLIALVGALCLYAAESIAQTPADSEFTQLLSRLQSSNEEDRYDAAVKLGSWRSPQTTAALQSALTDSSEKVRAAAIMVLSQAADARLVSLFAEAFARDKSLFVKKAAVYALGESGSAAATPILLTALKDKQVEVRGAAAVALGRYTDTAAIEGLQQALFDKSDFVRAQAAYALGLRASRAANAVATLIRLLERDRAHTVRQEVATALGRIGDRAALSALEKAERNPDPYLSLAAREAIRLIATPNP